MCVSLLQFDPVPDLNEELMDMHEEKNPRWRLPGHMGERPQLAGKPLLPVEWQRRYRLDAA